MAQTVEALRALALDDVVVVDDGSSDAHVRRRRSRPAPRCCGSPATPGRAEPSRVRSTGCHPPTCGCSPTPTWGSSARRPRLAARRRDGPGAPTWRSRCFPPQSGGGMGSVKRASAAAIRLLSRYRAEAPLSGQRALTASVPRRRPSARRRVRHGDGDDDRRGPGGVPGRGDPGRRSHASRHRPDPPRLPPPRTPGDADRAGLDAAGGAVAMSGGRLAVANHRGVIVPRTLGLWLALAPPSPPPWWSRRSAGRDRCDARGVGGAQRHACSSSRRAWSTTWSPTGPRGFRNHLRALAGGRAT